jgi:hypothetical protein
MRRVGLSSGISRLWEASEQETGVAIEIDAGAARTGADS